MKIFKSLVTFALLSTLVGAVPALAQFGGTRGDSSRVPTRFLGLSLYQGQRLFAPHVTTDTLNASIDVLKADTVRAGAGAATAPFTFGTPNGTGLVTAGAITDGAGSNAFLFQTHGTTTPKYTVFRLANDNDWYLTDDSGATIIFADESTRDLGLLGNVGIGTDAPSVSLDLQSGTVDIAALFESSDAGAYINGARL